MDSLLSAAARALATGDVLGALSRISLRDDPPALALRGIAMAQLGEHPRARQLLRRAAQGFGAHEARARARCLVAEAEVALAQRELAPGSSAPLARSLEAAAATLEAQGDLANALLARLVALRRLILIGRLEAAAQALARLKLEAMPPALRATAELAAAELALRSLRTAVAGAALARAREAAAESRIPALQAEVADAQSLLERPVARRALAGGGSQALCMAEAEALLHSGAVVVDACRRGLRVGQASCSLVRRPLLFSLVRALAEAWPGEVARETLIERVFRQRQPDETHRARLRVELGRLRRLCNDLQPGLRIEAGDLGYRLCTPPGQALLLLLPPKVAGVAGVEGEHAPLLALLADGAAWSTSALALASDASQRTVQRALVELEASGLVRSVGRARAQRWLAPPLLGAAGFATILLLPAALPLT